MLEQIQAALEQIRSQLQMDGGDVKLLEVTPEGEVHVALIGSCAGCPLSRSLIKCGIERSLSNVPQVTRVVTVDQRVPR